MKRQEIDKILRDLRRVIGSSSTWKRERLITLLQQLEEIPTYIRSFIDEGYFGYDKSVRRVFPPCVTPLWGDFSGAIVGIWNHFSFSVRASTIVEIDMEMGVAVEVARDFKQLAHVVALNILENEGEMNDVVTSYCKQLGIVDAAMLHRIWRRYGDDVAGLLELPSFLHAPQDCIEDLSMYKGEFPVYQNICETIENLNSVNSFEYHDRFEEGLPKNTKEPNVAWLQKNTCKKAVFEENFKAGCYDRAWMALCSSGWKFEDAVFAFSSLCDVIDDFELKAYFEVWSRLDFPGGDTY